MSDTSDLARYIARLFNKDHFPNSVPTPDSATHAYYSDFAGQMGYIVEQLEKLDFSVLSPTDQPSLGEAKNHIKHALKKGEMPEHPGRTHGLSARYLATIYHLLQERVVMSNPTARRLVEAQRLKNIRLFRVIEEHDQVLELQGPPGVWCGSSCGERVEDIPGWGEASLLQRGTFKEARDFALHLTARAARADPLQISPEIDALRVMQKGIRAAR